MLKTDAILKTDEVGRVRTPAARRESLLNEFERSGLSGQKFATLAGIKYQTFAAWARKRRGERGASATTAVKPVDSARWLEAVVEQAQPPGALVLQLPGGIRVEVASTGSNHNFSLVRGQCEKLWFDSRF
jgi:hypothetical protein